MNRCFSRRGFLRASVGATGVLARRSFLLEASPISQPLIAAPPSDTVQFGIVGCGGRGSGLLKTAIDLPGVKCAAACDLWDGRLDLAKEIVAKPILTTRRYQELLENKDVDCILAPCTDHWHKQVIVDCCKAGKDVYCEKPMTHAVEEGYEIINANKTARRIIQIGSQEPSSVIYAKAKELLAAGAIGKISLIEAVMGRNDHCGAWGYTVPPTLSPQTLDWNSWLGSAPKCVFDGKRYAQWRCYQDYGEGIPGDLFIHHLTGIHYVLGITTPPRRAFSQGGIYRWHDGRDVPDVMTTIYDYGDFSVTLRVTLGTETDGGFRFMGNKGIMEIHGVENPESLSISPQDGLDHGPCTPGWPSQLRAEYAAQWRKEHEGHPGESKAVEVTNFYAPPEYDDTREHLWNFFQSVKTRRASVEDEVFGHVASVTCHMANSSYFSKTAAYWDEAGQKIKT